MCQYRSYIVDEHRRGEGICGIGGHVKFIYRVTASSNDPHFRPRPTFCVDRDDSSCCTDLTESRAALNDKPLLPLPIVLEHNAQCVVTGKFSLEFLPIHRLSLFSTGIFVLSRD